MVKEKNFSRKFIAVLCVLFALLGISLWKFGFKAYGLKNELRNAEIKLEQDKEELESQIQENAENRAFIDNGDINELIEKYAKENYGYVYPDEHVYYIAQ